MWGDRNWTPTSDYCWPAIMTTEERVKQREGNMPVLIFVILLALGVNVHVTLIKWKSSKKMEKVKQKKILAIWGRITMEKERIKEKENGSQRKVCRSWGR